MAIEKRTDFNSVSVNVDLKKIVTLLVAHARLCEKAPNSDSWEQWKKNTKKVSEEVYNLLND